MNNKQNIIGKENKLPFGVGIEEIGSIGLIGSSGTGKTELAIQFANNALQTIENVTVEVLNPRKSYQRTEDYYGRKFSKMHATQITYTEGIKNILIRLDKLVSELDARQQGRDGNAIVVLLDDMNSPTLNLRLECPEKHRQYIEQLERLLNEGALHGIHTIIVTQSCMTNECPASIINALGGYFLFNANESQFEKLEMYKNENLHTPRKPGECWYKKRNSPDIYGLRIILKHPIE